MKIILIGLPGSGKTTQGKILSQVFQLPFLSMRECIKQIVKGKSELSNEIKDFWGLSNSWQPLSDQLAIAVFNHLISESNSYILEGFPRNVSQAFPIKKLLLTEATCIWLDISMHLSYQRQVLRKDDRLQILKRINTEQTRFFELIKFLPDKIQVDAEQPISKVSDQILNQLSNRGINGV